MNAWASTSKQWSAVLGIVVLLLVAIPLKMIDSVKRPWMASPESVGRNTCAYQVIHEGTCLGTVLMEKASAPSHILLQVGVSSRQRSNIPDEAIPCNCTIRLEGDLPPRVERMSGRQLICAGQRIDVNLAEAKDFTALPGIGPGLAARIVHYRDLHGYFTSTTDLQGIPGIGKKRMAAVAPFIKANRVRSGPLASEHPGPVASVSPSTRVSQKPNATQP